MVLVMSPTAHRKHLAFPLPGGQNRKMDLATGNRHRIHLPHQGVDPFFISKDIGEIGELASYIYAGGMGGKPCSCRVAVEKQFRGRRPAGSKAPEILRQDTEEEEFEI